jgi:hypothetical protein
MSQFNPVNNLTPYFFNVNFNIVLSFDSKLVSPLQVFALKFCVHVLLHLCMLLAQNTPLSS